MEQISYRDIAKRLDGIRRGSVVYLVSDIMRLVFACRKNGEKFSADAFLDSLLQVIGPEGTLLVPCFNWDFCRGVPYDARSTPSRVGVLGDAARARADFTRTQHPLYSFAVWGKDAKQLADAQPVTCFGGDSPFAYMHKVGAVALVAGLSPTAGTTFIHYVEEREGAPYRYFKDFTGSYTDMQGVQSEKTVRMFVRDLEIDPQYITGLDNVLTQLNVAHTQLLLDTPFHTVRLPELYQIAAIDLHCNEARGMYTFDRTRWKLDYTGK